MKQKIDIIIHNSMMNDIKFVSEIMMFQITRYIKTFPEYICVGSKIIKHRYPILNTTTIRIYFEETIIDTKIKFYCQSEIEGNKKCITQCDHCKEYYKPLE